MCLRVLIGHSIICRVFVFDLNLKTRTLKTVKYTGKLHEKIMNYFFMVLKADYSSPYFFFVIMYVCILFAIKTVRYFLCVNKIVSSTVRLCVRLYRKDIHDFIYSKNNIRTYTTFCFNYKNVIEFINKYSN